MRSCKLLVSLFHYIIFTLLVTAVWAGYYDSITTSSPTFAKDLQTRVWNPFNAKTYAGFTVYVSDYASYSTSSGKRGVRCVYTYENYEYTPPFAWGYFSREHTWCQSWMPVDAEPQHSDYHHLFPLNQNNANGRRSNHPYGKVVNVTYQYLEGKLGTDSSGNTVYEPRDGHKGDAARALFYMAMCYNGINSMDWTFSHLSSYLVSASECPQSIELLKQWHAQDPPDRWEVERNDWVQGKQSNRNPFVDHPEYVNYINFLDMSKVNPAFATVPTNHLTNFTTGSVGSNSITLTWTDAVAGTQSPTGYMVLAYDTNNYFIPEAGSTYPQCSDLSNDSGIVYISYPSSGTYTFNNLKSNMTYYFRVYPYNGSSTTISYKVDGTVPSLQATTITGTLATEPSNNPTGLVSISTTTTSIKIAWTNATGAVLPSAYLIQANNNGSFSLPVDGNSYTDNTTLGSGVAQVNIPYSSSNTTYQFTNLALNQTYYFQVYSYNGTGNQINYNTNGTIATITVATLPAPALPAILTLDPSYTDSTTAIGQGNVTNLGYPNPTHYGFIWDTNSAPALSLTTKTDHGALSTLTSFTDTITGLQPQTLYYLRTYITNSMGTAYGNEISFYTLSSEPPSHVTDFSATAQAITQINLSWTTAVGCSGYVVLQKSGSTPTGIPLDSQAYMVNDIVGDASVAVVLSSGTSNSSSITGLTPGTTYYFTIFPYNFDGTNTDTYNYKTTVTIPYATATTQSLPNQGPAVIINEFSQGASGAKEWVELLVVQNNLNLQGYKLTDSASNLSITLSGSGFSNLPQGMLIVLYNGGDIDPVITPDLDSSDNSLQISSLNVSGTWAITRTTGWNGTTGAFGNASNTNVPRLIDASSNTVFIFPRTPTPAGGKSCSYNGNTASGATTASNWSADTSSASATPGQPNGGINTTWINTLRLVPVELSSFDITDISDPDKN